MHLEEAIVELTKEIAALREAMEGGKGEKSSRRSRSEEKDEEEKSSRRARSEEKDDKGEEEKSSRRSRSEEKDDGKDEKKDDKDGGDSPERAKLRKLVRKVVANIGRADALKGLKEFDAEATDDVREKDLEDAIEHFEKILEG